MRIAFTGTSSTGKTTLAKRVFADSRYATWKGKFITTNARGLLDELGHAGVDAMTISQRRDFQWLYLERKLEAETLESNFLTDRSYIDVAAYWLEYNQTTNDQSTPFIQKCREATTRYNKHFYFPANLLAVEMDGYRSKDKASHARIDTIIQSLAKEWAVELITLDSIDLATRASAVYAAIAGGDR